MSSTRCSWRCRTWHGGSERASPRADRPRKRRFFGRTGAKCSDRGVALPGVLLLSAFLVAITGWLVGHVRTDVTLAALSVADDDGGRLVQAALEAVALALAGVADWRPAGGVVVPLGCPTPSRSIAALDAAAERTRVQAAFDAGGRWGADAPQFAIAWTCHGEGVLGRWPGPGDIPAVIVLIADDPEGDGQPAVSTNERLLLRAVGRGIARTRSEAAATISRATPGAPVVLAAFRRSPAG